MYTQHVADRTSSNPVVVAFQTQHRGIWDGAYLLTTCRSKLRGGYTQVTKTSRYGQYGLRAAEFRAELDRSRRCPRASNSSQWSGLLQRFPHAANPNRRKSTLWLTQSRSRSNRSIPASISKLDLGRAIPSVPLSNAIRFSKTVSHFNRGVGSC